MLRSLAALCLSALAQPAWAQELEPVDAALRQDDECRAGTPEACGLNAVQLRGVSSGKTVSILHISDTHSLHRPLDKQFPLPPADILLHTGDVSNFGNDAELKDFNAWLGEIKDRYKHIVMITGNHDWIDPIEKVAGGKVAAGDALSLGWMQAKIPNAVVLNNSMVEVMGLKIYGSGWAPWYGYAQPGDPDRMQWTPARAAIFDAYSASKGGSAPTHIYGDIPENVDILMTHEPAWGFFDASWGEHWGSSKELRKAIERAKPKAHLFGHVHEQRGVWQRSSPGGEYGGGVEYAPKDGKP